MDTRKQDRLIIEKGLKAKDPNERHQAKVAMDKINKEDSWTSSARQSLLRETMARKTANATDIREEMVKHEGRKNQSGSISFGFHIPEGIFKK